GAEGAALCGEAAAPALSALVVTGGITTAFDRRCIPADCVAPPSNMLNILSRRALSAERLDGLGAAP
ncbi:MAG TPA: hypothetical protein VMO26_22290, partial [Vicinamibacterales bacterium]|nr:hypothetical protein [Vicinamibacterales bacterium]